jgi:hypothetical protein
VGEDFGFEAAATVYAGSLVCLTAEGKAVPASVTAGLTPVVGVALRQTLPGETVPVHRGTYPFDAATGDAPTLADIGKECFVVDDHTVGKTAGANSPRAGIVYDVNDDGVWVKI